MNRIIDYGFNWMFYQEEDLEINERCETKIYQQLKYFYERKKNSEYIKAAYLHYLLDFFKETYIDIYNVDLVFDRFLQYKVVCEISNSDGVIINFQDEINDVFRVIRENKEELYKDLKG